MTGFLSDTPACVFPGLNPEKKPMRNYLLLYPHFRKKKINLERLGNKKMVEANFNQSG